MPASQTGNCYLLDRSNGQRSIFSTSTPPCTSSSASLKLVDDRSGQFLPLQAASPEYFAYYQTLIDASILPGNSAPNDPRDGDDGHGHSSHVNSAEAGDGLGSQQLVRPQAVPCNLAARHRNRSNGASLATIIEQGSYSTLNSYGSLPSEGRYQSLTIASNASPGQNENAVEKTREDTCQEQHHLSISEVDARLDQDNRNPVYTVNGRAKPIEAITMHPHFSGSPQSSVEHDRDSTSLSEFFRGILHTVRSASRSRSRSSLTTQAPHVDSREERPGTSESSLDSPLHISEGPQTTRDKCDLPSLLHASNPNATTVSSHDPQARSRKISAGSHEPFCASSPLLISPPHQADAKVDSSFVPFLLPPSAVTHAREWYTSVRLVHPEPRDEAHAGGTAEAESLASESRHGNLAQYSFEASDDRPRNASSLTENDHTKDLSRNTSFCSTMSTSYSGTVLGVDLDLDHQLSLAPPLRHSRSPTVVAPIWFTPQMAERERQASFSESPETRTTIVPDLPRRSITSSAMPSLLTIAAASGIVQPNYTTPKISFYSPSGNLIQPEGNLTPETSSLDVTDSPIENGLYYSNQSPSARKVFPTATCLPSARPALVPMTTPTYPSSPLPAHLKHHHNYRQPERSQIDSVKTFVVSTPKVQGCGGVVQSPSFVAREGPPYQLKKIGLNSDHKQHQSSRAFVDDLKFEAKFHRARVINAVSTSCLSFRAGRKPRKRFNTTDSKPNIPYTHVYHDSSQTQAKSTSSSVRLNHIRIHTHPTQQDDSVLGPITGHTLRICFCQPYDGAGKPTRAIAADASSCMTKHIASVLGWHETSNVCRNVRDADGELPNARVVSGRNGCTKKEQASDGGKHNRTRSDSAVSSVRIALRVAAVGG